MKPILSTLVGIACLFAFQVGHAAPKAASSQPRVESNAVLIMDAGSGQTLYNKNSQRRVPIASITKLMTAMVTLDAGLPMNERIRITSAEVDRLKNTHSRMTLGTTLARREMLLLALMSSENRAAAALARTYPGGRAAFIRAMNRKARQLGMSQTRFHDATGLNPLNVASAEDLAKMVRAASRYPVIRQFTTTTEYRILAANGRQLHYRNSNALVREGKWEIDLSKTGYIQEAGRCLVMMTRVRDQRLVMVLLDAKGGAARLRDARNLKAWVERQPPGESRLAARPWSSSRNNGTNAHRH